MTVTREAEIDVGTAESHAEPVGQIRDRALLQSRVQLILARILLVCIVLAAWQWVPPNQNLLAFMDPYFVASPTRVARAMWTLATGAQNNPLIWPALGGTLQAAMFGASVAVCLGSIGGLLCSHSPVLWTFFRPFIVAMSAVPRITLIPIVVIMFGNSTTTSAVSAAIVTVFLVFFNAVEGGRSVSREVIANARLLGAPNFDIIWRIRWRYVMVWVFAILPSIVSYAIISALTAELFSGGKGIGRLFELANYSANSAMTFALVIYISTASVIIVLSAEKLKGVLLHWWEEERG